MKKFDTVAIFEQTLVLYFYDFTYLSVAFPSPKIVMVGISFRVPHCSVFCRQVTLITRYTNRDREGINCIRSSKVYYRIHLTFGVFKFNDDASRCTLFPFSGVFCCGLSNNASSFFSSLLMSKNERNAK